MEKGKISAAQMGFILFPTISATAILLVPAITMEYAEQDMWLSPIWASITGFVTVFIAVQLNRLYPQETPIQYSQRILGAIPGKFIGLLFLLFYLHVTGIVIREYGEFIVGSFLQKTPISVVLGSMIFTCALAVRCGVEVIGRLAQLIVPVIVLFLLFLIVLLLPDINIKYMLPVMENGLKPSIRGALAPQSWFSEFFLMSFLLPFLTDRKKGSKYGMLSVIFVMVAMFATNLTVLTVFGKITDGLTYPVMAAARFISIADFLEHLEAFVMAIWVAGTFIKVCAFYYALVLGTSQWLNLPDYRPLVFPMGFLLVLFGIWSAASLPELNHFLGTTFPFYLTIVQTIIPLLLLGIGLVRCQRYDPNEEGPKR